MPSCTAPHPHESSTVASGRHRAPGMRPNPDSDVRDAVVRSASCRGLGSATLGIRHGCQRIGHILGNDHLRPSRFVNIATTALHDTRTIGVGVPELLRCQPSHVRRHMEQMDAEKIAAKMTRSARRAISAIDSPDGAGRDDSVGWRPFVGSCACERIVFFCNGSSSATDSNTNPAFADRWTEAIGGLHAPSETSLLRLASARAVSSAASVSPSGLSRRSRPAIVTLYPGSGEDASPGRHSL